MMAESSALSSLLQLLVNFVLFLFLALRAFHGKLNYTGLIQKLILVSYVILSVTTIMLFILPNAPFPKYQDLMLTVWLLGTIGTARLLLQSNVFQLLFFVFMLLDFQFNIMQLSGLIYHMNIIPCIAEAKDIQFLFVTVLVTAIFVPPLWYIFIRLFRNVINKNIDQSYWSYLFVIPTSAYLYCIFNATNTHVHNVEKPELEIILVLLLNVFSFLSFTVVLQLLLKTSESLEATQKNSYMQQQLLIQNEQYQKLAENMSQTERVRHDLRHHFITIKGYLTAQDIEGASRYLEDCIGTALPKDNAPICEHHAVDMILRHYLALGREAGAQVVAAVHLPADFGMSDAELCVVFGNLVENAVESCKRQTTGKKFISVKAKIVGETMLALTVSNSYSGKITQDSGNFMSCKRDGIGIGTWSVKSIVEKSGGTCKFTFDEYTFKVSVLIVAE